MIDGTDALGVVLMDVRAERERQLMKWGDQSRSYDGTGPNSLPLFSPDEWCDDTLTATQLAAKFKNRTDERMSRRSNGADMADILLEEVFEALAEDDPAKLRGELVQVAAVVAQWMEYLDRRGANVRPADA